MKCVSGISEFFPVSSGVRQGGLPVLQLLTLVRTGLWEESRRLQAVMCHLGDAWISDDAALLVEMVYSLAGTLETLSDEANLLGRQLSWVETKIQSFGSILGDAIVSIEVLDNTSK